MREVIVQSDCEGKVRLQDILRAIPSKVDPSSCVIFYDDQGIGIRFEEDS